MRSGRIWLFIIPVFTAFVSMSLFWLSLVQHWFGPPGYSASEFCEAIRPGLVKQPYNTWSNLAFIISGIYIGWLLKQQRFNEYKNPITQSQFYGVFYACLVVLLGPGSMCMHATTSASGGFFDMLSMYLVVSFTTAYAALRLFRLTVLKFVIFYITVLLICLWADNQAFHIIFSFFGDTIFALFISATLAMEVANSLFGQICHDRRWGIAAILFLLLAFLIWNISQTGSSLCNPYSPVQGHAVWHILDAVSTFCLFRYYVSEQLPEKKLVS